MAQPVKTILFMLFIAGVLLRLYHITANEFLFYDEGMYLGYNRAFLDLVAANPPKNINEFSIILGLMFTTALTTAKALWFFILNLRVFFTGTEGWYFARIVSALAGFTTIALTYVWAKRYYFRSSLTAGLSAVILAVLPSHVFYSRLGMQESLSALLFLSGIYCYVFSPRGVSAKSLLAAVFLSAAFFTNYRMIIAPVFIILIQLWVDREDRQKNDIQKVIWFCVAFAAIVFGVGSLYGGVNTYVTFGWMFHQADEAQAHRHLLNFCSFPYYVFALENVVFGLLFFANVYLLLRRQWRGLLPFAIVILQMVLFSFAAEKGARYLCVVLPFEAMAVARMIVWVKEQYPKYNSALYAAAGLMFAGLLWQSFALARAGTDYGKAIAMVLEHDPQAKIISTQPLVESLFVHDERRVVDCPKDPAALQALMSQGYRYLILDPQMYISWTADGQRFTPVLVDHLELIRRSIQPVAVLPHIDGVLLKRFVLDHNQDLWTSLRFLNDPKGKGEIYIYSYEVKK